MKFLVFGAGAIGGYTGGSLALSGEQVTFLERPQAAGYLRQHGIYLSNNGRRNHIHPVDVTETLPEALQLTSYDAALVAVKSYDTEALVNELLPYRDHLPPVLCLQNGVENEARLANLINPEKVIAGTVTSSVSKPAVGEFVVERSRGIGIAGDTHLNTEIAQAFRKAGIPVRVYPNAGGMKWSKMLTNLPANATTAILDMTPAEIFSLPGLFRLEIAMMRECVRVMKKLSIPVVDLPSVPVRALVFAVTSLPLPIARILIMRGLGAGRGAKMPSFHIDLYAGRKQSEVDYLNGAVVRFGREVGVATPVNQLLTKTLINLTTGAEDIKTYAHQPDKLIRLAE